MAGRFANLPGPGPGRPKGSPNRLKAPTTEDLLQRLHDIGWDSVTEFVLLYRDPECPHGTRAKMLETVMKLEFPGRKAVEHSGTIEHKTFNIRLDASMPTSATIVQPRSENDYADAAIKQIDAKAEDIDPDSNF